MRLLAFFEYAAIIIGILAVASGRFFALPKGLHLGIFLIGAGIALGGLESVLTQRLGFRPSEDSGEAYAGAPAVIVGLLALFIGAVLIAAAYALADGSWGPIARHLTRRPAPVLIAAGLLALGAGALLMFNRRGRRGLVWMLLMRVPGMLLGLALIVSGLAAIGLGVWEWREPLAFNRFVRSVSQTLDRPVGAESAPAGKRR